MALEQRLNLKLAQRLVMTPSLQQAIKLLQLSRLELAEEIAQELVENPVLEEQDEQEAAASAEEPSEDAPEPGGAADEPDLPLAEAPSSVASEASETTAAPDDESHDPIDEIDLDAYFRDSFESSSAPNMSELRELPSLDNTPASSPDLATHLSWQLGMQVHEPRLVQAGKAILGNLDDDGYLQATDDEILEGLASLAEEDADIAAYAPYTAHDVERARRRITQFDPVGCACRTLEQCLLAQLQHLGLADSPAADVVSRHLDLLRKHAWAEIARKVDVDEAEARRIGEVIRHLNPKPGASFGGDRTHVVTPDVVVLKVEGEYKIVLNDEGLPRLRISPVYRRLLERARAARAGAPQAQGEAAPDRETRDYVREKLRSALWFIKSLDQRQQTIYRVAESIVKHQRQFLDVGLEALRPMVLRDVAEDVGMHESTVSRVVTNKYMHTPRGLFEMKFFFHSGLSTASGEDISSLTVKRKIQKLIEDEPSERPLSDSALVKILTAEKIDIARRTVAKYRDELGIPSSALRKRG